MNDNTIIIVVSTFLIFSPSNFASADETGRWWPYQSIPKGVIRTTDWTSFEPVTSPNGKTNSGPFGATHIMVQALAGLAAQAVNERRLDELVWITNENPSSIEWYSRLNRRISLEDRGVLTPWQLVERFKAKGIVEGYILYSYDDSEGSLYSIRDNMDESVNVATSLAGILHAILIEEGQEERARKIGLEKLLDVRDKSPEWCFATYKDRFNRKLLCTQDPKVPNIRALAIAHKTFTLYGVTDFTAEVMEWLEPLSPILGWNGGDEFSQTVMPSEYACFQSATNWCLNLPLLMAGSENFSPPKIERFDPATIDWSDERCATAFVMSDGDNAQWLMNSFFHSGGNDYWDSPDRGAFPMGWTSCFDQLLQLCPPAVEYISETRTSQTSFIQCPGGYNYPDRFGRRRSDGDLLSEHARRVWANMQKCGVQILFTICHDVRSAQAMRVFQTYAREMDGLLGIMAYQYSPYEAGAGEIFWVKDGNGIEIPVVTARYTIWNNANQLGPRIGTPAKVARAIDETAAKAITEKRQTMDWTIVHCWSFFKESLGTDEDAENMDQESAFQNGGRKGVTPVAWCVRRLSPEVKVVCPEELLWRIRMERNPQQTKAILQSPNLRK